MPFSTSRSTSTLILVELPRRSRPLKSLLPARQYFSEHLKVAGAQGEMTTARGKAGETAQREWQPRIWEGCDFFAWARLLVRNQFAIGWRYLYIALVVSLVSIFHTLLRWLPGGAKPQEAEFALCMMGQPSPYLTIAFPNRPPQDQDAFSVERMSPRQRAAWKRAFVRFLKQLTSKDPRRLVLESPTHSCRIPVLLELFPDARFVHIVR